MLTICSLIFQIIIQAGLLKKGLCSVQDESAGQLVIFSHRRDAYKAVISKVSFPQVYHSSFSYSSVVPHYFLSLVPSFLSF